MVGIGVLSFLYIFRALFSIIYHYVSHLQFLRVGSSINPLSCSSVVNLTQLTTYRSNTPTDSEDSSDSNSKMSTDEEEEELRSTYDSPVTVREFTERTGAISRIAEDGTAP